MRWDDKDEFGFDWRETPSSDHPGRGKKCPCPKCEAIREKVNDIKNNGLPIILRLCPDHFRVYQETMYDGLTWFEKQMSKLFTKLKIIEVRQLAYMASDLCFYCKFGSGGRSRKKIAPVP